MKQTIYTLLTIFALFTGLCCFVFGQGGVGPSGKRFVNHANEVVVLPNGYDYTYAAKDGTIVYDGGFLYVYVAANGKWTKFTGATPTSTPTPSSTATATATPTP